MATGQPSFSSIAEFIGLDRLFSTWWFLLLVGALYLNTLACTINQVELGVNLYFRRPIFLSRTALSSTKEAFLMDLEKGADNINEKIELVLKRHGYRTVIFPTGDSTNRQDSPPIARIYAEKGRLGVLGSPILHIGLLLALTAVGWSALMRFTGYVEVGEGQLFTDTNAAYLQYSEGPLFGNRYGGFDLRVDRVTIKDPIAYGRFMDETAESDVTIWEGSKKVAGGTLVVNNSLEYKGKRIFQTSLFGPAVLLQTVYQDGSGERGMVNLTRDENGIFGNTLYLPRSIYKATLLMDSVDGDVNIEIRWRDDLLYSGPIKPGQRLDMDGVSLSLIDRRHWTGLRVVSDQSQPLLFGGFLITVIGLFVCAAVSRRQIWLLVEGIGDNHRIAGAGITRKHSELFAEEFNEIQSVLRASIG